MGSVRTKYVKFALIAVVLLSVSIMTDPHSFTAFGSADPRIKVTAEPPEVLDQNLKVEQIVEGLEVPTSMAFLGPDDILVLEKNKGSVRRVVEGQLLPEAVLGVNVANKNERGMLGIAIDNNSVSSGIGRGKINVYLTFTESEVHGIDICISDHQCEEGNDPLGNRLYRYEFINDRLTNPELLLDLPALPGPAHNGGVVVIGPDTNIYFNIGDVRGPVQNPEKDESGHDGRAGILRVAPDGQPVGKGILGEEHPINFYYAYGIRNSFGMDFDPVTGNLWDTENGPDYGDELNLVVPGFNSGWRVIQGFAENEEDMVLLEDFAGRGKYRDPEFVWGESVGPTALKFLNSDKLGKQYENDMFVGDVHRGNIYHFVLNTDRTGLVLQGNLEDKVGTGSEMEEVIFGRNFGGISDIEVGPDGYLYIVSIGLGKIFRIVPT